MTTWPAKLGFQIWHVPGISRAWRYDFVDGSYALLTDAQGYDLPEVGEPYSAMLLTVGADLEELRSFASPTKSFYRWFRRVLRRHRLRREDVPHRKHP